MPIDNSGERMLIVETNVGGQMVDLEDTDYRENAYGRNQQREPRRQRMQSMAEASAAHQAKKEAENPAPKPKRKRRTKAEIEADKLRDQKLKEAHTKDLKNKNLK